MAIKRRSEEDIDRGLQELEKVINKKNGTNGDIPVKCEWTEVYYDVEHCRYYAIAKIGYKKISLTEDSE